MENSNTLADVRKYIPYATAKDIARLGVPPQDYAAFGYEYFRNHWCAQHIVLAANMEAVKDATAVFEVQTRWYDASNQYMGEGAALIPTFNIKAARDIFAAYVRQQFGAVRIMEFPDKRAPMLMYGRPAAFNAITGEKLSWWDKAVKRGDIRCLNGEGRRPDPKPSVKETTLADGRRIVEDEIIVNENKQEEIKMESNKINNNNVVMDDDLELTDDFCVIDEAHRSSIANDEPATVEESAPVKTVKIEPVIEYKSQAAVWADAHNYESVGSPHARSLYDHDDNNDDNGSNDDTPPVNPSPNKSRKMPGVIAGLNVTAALAAGLTMAEAAQRMGEIRNLRAKLKALGKPGVEVKVPTRPQRVRGHKLADAVASFELFEDFYKVLVEEFEAKHGAATPAVDNPLPAEPEAATVQQEQKEISPDVPDTVAVEVKPLPEKPEDDPEDPPQVPEEPSDGNNDNGDVPTDDNMPTPPASDGNDNNSGGTGAASNVAAASADQDNSPADFYNEEGVPEETVPATPEEVYGDAIRKVLRKYGNDTSSLGTVQLFLHDEHRLVVDFDTDEGIEVDDESLDWVAEQIAKQQVTNDSGYNPYGHDDLDDIDETSLTPQQPQEPAQQPDPEPQPVESSHLITEYKAMIEKYLKLPNYVIDGGGVLSDAEVAKLVAAKKQQDADTLTLGGQMLLAFFGNDTIRAAAELDAAINGYNPKKVRMTKLQEMQFSKRTTLKVIEGVRQDKEGNFYVKGSRGKLLHDWLRVTVVDGIGFVFENPPKDRRFFR